MIEEPHIKAAIEHKFKLNSGYEIPVLGFGTFRASKNKDSLKSALKCAIKNGYRHIDTAWIYETEDLIGETLEEVYSDPQYNIRREDLFITTKVWNSFHSRNLVHKHFEESLQRLKTNYVDLLLIHWPTGYEENVDNLEPLDKNGFVIPSNVSYVETYKTMEELVQDGRVKSIGISNFNIRQVQEILNNCEIKPAVNQIEIHPYLQNDKLVDFCQNNGIVVVAYASLGSGLKDAFKDVPFILEHPILVKIADKYKKTSAQVCLRWAIQRNIAVIPKSVTCSRVEMNSKIFDFELNDDDMSEIKKINKNLRIFACEELLKHKDYPFFED